MELRPNESINLVTNMEKAFAKVELTRSKVNTLRVVVRVLELLFVRESKRYKELTIEMGSISFQTKTTKKVYI